MHDYILQSPLFPSYSYSSTLYLIQPFPLSLFHSFHPPSTLTYPPMEIIIPHKTSHNKVDQITYADDILTILLNSLHVHENDDVTKRCDFCIEELKEHIDQFKNHQFSSSYLLLE